jgi:CRISPR/Cas system-associated endonuclease Cas1
MLLIADEDSTVHREGGRFIVTDKGIDLLEARAIGISSIVLVGRVELTSETINLALSREWRD